MVTLKLGNNIYPTYLDGGSQPHLNRVVIQKVQATTLAFRAEEAARDYDADDVVLRSRGREGLGLI